MQLSAMCAPVDVCLLFTGYTVYCPTEMLFPSRKKLSGHFEKSFPPSLIAWFSLTLPTVKIAMQCDS